jgi:hypothetical protein
MFTALSVGLLGSPDTNAILDAALRNEGSASVQELYSAQYRLGREDRLDPLLEIISENDFRVTTVGLNALLGLTRSPTLMRMRSRWAQISRAVAAAVARDAVHAGLAEQIVGRLEA